MLFVTTTDVVTFVTSGACGRRSFGRSRRRSGAALFRREAAGCTLAAIGPQNGVLVYSKTFRIIHPRSGARWIASGRRSNSDSLPVEARMLHDRFTFLREAYPPVKVFVLKVIALVEYLYLVFTSLPHYRTRKNAVTAYWNALKAVYHA
jgi:hypothetical protein